LAAAWAILHFLGNDGYRAIVDQVARASQKMIAAIDAMPDLRVLGRPDMSIFALESPTLNVFQLADAMRARGWYLQPQFSADPLRPNIHITVNDSTVPHVEAFIHDLAGAVAETKATPPIDMAEVKSQIEQMLSALPLEEAAAGLYELAGIRGAALPEETAFINSVLNVLPTPVAERLLLEYFNDLYV
jgi:glutamate/tyrosine decarboxylase-like PLP-dependent enzyme